MLVCPLPSQDVTSQVNTNSFTITRMKGVVDVPDTRLALEKSRSVSVLKLVYSSKRA